MITTTILPVRPHPKTIEISPNLAVPAGHRPAVRWTQLRCDSVCPRSGHLARDHVAGARKIPPPLRCSGLRSGRSTTTTTKNSAKMHPPRKASNISALPPGPICAIVSTVRQSGGALGAVVAQLLYTETVAGSNPAVPTIPPHGDDSTSSDPGFTQEPRAFLQSRIRFEPKTSRANLFILKRA